MNNKALVLLIGIVVLGGAGFLIFNSQGEQATDRSESQQRNLNSPTEINNEDAMEDDSQSVGDNMSDNGSYMIYSDSEFQKATDKRRVLFFYANWCPTCIPADQEFSDNSGLIPEDVVVYRVNYNDSDTEPYEEELANEYGVTYQHTFVQVDQNGNEVAKWNGGAMDELLQNIKN